MTISDADVNDFSVDYRVIVLDSVRFELTEPWPMLLFRESEGQRSFSIPVAVADAQAIATVLSGQRGRRPTSSDITALLLTELRCDVVAVRIVRFVEGVYYAELDVMTHLGRRVFDLRPSDAIAIALRHPGPVPFLIAEDVLQVVCD